MGDPLSQEEIDRLLNAAGGGDTQEASPESAQAQAEEAAAPGPAGTADETTSVEAAAEAEPQPAPEMQAPAEPQYEPQAAVPNVADPPWQGAQSAQTFTVVDSGPQPGMQSRPGVFGAATGSGSVPQDIQFGALPQGGPTAGQPRSIDLLLDVKLQLTVELGRRELTVKEALNLGPGSVIELDRIAGEPVDLFVNGKLIARGEVVVIDENFGVRVTEVVSPAERIRRVA